MATSESHATVTSDSKNNNNVNSKEDIKSTTPRSTASIPESVPTSPSYPPYGGAYMDPAQLAAANGYDVSDSVNYTTTYVYPLSPQFSVQYYPDYSNGYQSYPGSPSLHPQSPPINPTSPPFSPTTGGYHQYQQNMSALSPPTHAYVLPPHHHSAQPYPPIHISSPVLTGTTSIPGSPPHQYLPGPYIIQTTTTAPTDNRSNHHKRNYNYPMPSEEQSFDSSLNSFHTHNIYVRGLSASTTDESFLEMCQVYGKIASSKAIIDQKTGECKGYGFAMFEDERECEEAIEGLNKAGLQASFARVGQESFSSRLKNLQDETSTNIYISNLPLDMTEQKLEELFEPYQTVSNRILRDPQTGMSRGVGFARLTDREAASAVIEKFNGEIIHGSSAPLQVRFADSPAQKRLKNQTARRRMVRPREFQSMAATLAIRPMMPITPETMLGIAPANSMHHPYYQTQ
ncbi:MAG: hypothetical protein EXX96DRAFT_492983 [Benjaminiella poitrasii]|nr:MAG: hypothetical protein EXX96DRAFT_116618 [Benjaminiella poitrasii]KAI9468242.1 MAG: hypothetical protein EXX96DRAFT_492983 [Benjaminiella poitrasii]